MIFGRLGGRFAHLGGSWGVTREVLASLGAVLAAVDAPGGVAPDFPWCLGSVLGSSWVPKKGPRRSPRRPKIDHKIDLKNDCVLERS